MDKKRNQSTDMLFNAILKLSTIEECYNFFDDLCTIKEVQDMAQRLEVAKMLNENISYIKISEKTGASTATISRVNKCLVYGSDGYKLALEKMELSKNILDKEEIITYTLRKLYKESGYKKYRMSKFEEYDLYVKNKDFLISDNIITFTDIDGKLMALKPDVTLSIIKNSKDCYDGIEKLYYNENVYRASQDTQSFKEIMQVGVECIGNIDSECICENILLAVKSLSQIKEDYILDISHLGIIEKIIKELGISEVSEKAVLKALGEKNLQAVDYILKEENVEKDKGVYLKTLVSTYGTPGDIIKKLKKEEFYPLIKEEIKLLEEIYFKLKENDFDSKTRIDFSVINDMNYYNGIAFKGFVNGVPGGVLSGGQYDKLMIKMDRKSRAIGFAVYLDVLERI